VKTVHGDDDGVGEHARGPGPGPGDYANGFNCAGVDPGIENVIAVADANLRPLYRLTKGQLETRLGHDAFWARVSAGRDRKRVSSEAWAHFLSSWGSVVLLQKVFGYGDARLLGILKSIVMLRALLIASLNGTAFRHALLAHRMRRRRVLDEIAHDVVRGVMSAAPVEERGRPIILYWGDAKFGGMKSNLILRALLRHAHPQLFIVKVDEFRSSRSCAFCRDAVCKVTHTATNRGVSEMEIRGWSQCQCCHREFSRDYGAASLICASGWRRMTGRPFEVMQRTRPEEQEQNLTKRLRELLKERGESMGKVTASGDVYARVRYLEDRISKLLREKQVPSKSSTGATATSTSSIVRPRPSSVKEPDTKRTRTAGDDTPTPAAGATATPSPGAIAGSSSNNTSRAHHSPPSNGRPWAGPNKRPRHEVDRIGAAREGGGC
jgi:hypothetical protein